MKAIHSLEQSRQNRDLLITGTITGIYRSVDSGETWMPSDPEYSSLVHVESLAIDPRNTNVIYAGTWYLPYQDHRRRTNMADHQERNHRRLRHLCDQYQSNPCNHVYRVGL